MAGKQRALIEIDSETRQTLDSLKIHPDESYDKVILRILRVVTPEQLSQGLTEDFKMKSLDVDVEWAKHIDQMEKDIKSKSFGKAERENKWWKKRVETHEKENED